MTAKEAIQKFIDQYGFRISVKDLADMTYTELRMDGFENVCIVNDRYIEVDGVTYYFSKSKKYNGWIAKDVVRRALA